MTPQELKNSILQLAIQGKLVEQCPEEGTGEELYQQIQTEKQRLIKAGIIKKEKPLPDISEDKIPFDIPESWKWVSLSSIGVTQTGNTPSKAHLEYIGEDVPFITPGDILNGNIAYNNQGLSTFGKLVARVCCAGAILQVCIGGSIGKAAITDREVTFNQQINSISPIYCDSKYIFAVMTSQYFVVNMKESAGGTATPIINRGVWDALLIPLPPLAEQKCIVAKIEELMPYIDRYEQAWSKLEELNKRFPIDMQKSILQMAIQGKLVEQCPEEGTGEELYQQIQAEKQRLIKAGTTKKEKPLPEISEDEKPFDIPESWLMVRLGDISLFQGGYAYKSNSYVSKSNNQVIRLGNVKNNRFLLEDKQVFIPDAVASDTERYRIREDDILVTMTGTRRKRDYLFTLLVSKDDLLERNLYINQRVGCFRVFRGIYPKYLLFVLQSDNIKDVIFTKETGTANQGNIGSEDMKQFVYIPLPPLAEQKRIVAKLEEVLPLCEKLKK